MGYPHQTTPAARCGVKTAPTFYVGSCTRHSAGKATAKGIFQPGRLLTYFYYSIKDTSGLTRRRPRQSEPAGKRKGYSAPGRRYRRGELFRQVLRGEHETQALGGVRPRARGLPQPAQTTHTHPACTHSTRATWPDRGAPSTGWAGDGRTGLCAASRCARKHPRHAPRCDGRTQDPAAREGAREPTPHQPAPRQHHRYQAGGAGGGGKWSWHVHAKRSALGGHVRVGFARATRPGGPRPPRPRCTRRVI